MIEVDNVSMRFHMNTDRIRSIKEYVTKALRGKVKYTDFTAVDGLTFTVDKGETLGLIGHNGAGKSTTLKLISGILKPSEGTVKVYGNVVPMLELGSGFDMELTGRENIFLNGAILGYSEEFLKAKLEEIIAFSELGQFIEAPLRTYSSGMLARLAFSVASVVDPEILIVDEALSVGDVFFQTKCFHKFEEFRKAGKTILFVSHDLGSIRRYCDRAILLDHGVKLEEGETASVIDTFKRVMVGQYNPDEVNADSEGTSAKTINLEENKGEWKKNYVLNPGSVSLPKESDIHSYLLMEDGVFLLKDLDGAMLRRWPSEE